MTIHNTNLLNGMFVSTVMLEDGKFETAVLDRDGVEVEVKQTWSPRRAVRCHFRLCRRYKNVVLMLA